MTGIKASKTALHLGPQPLSATEDGDKTTAFNPSGDVVSALRLNLTPSDSSPMEMAPKRAYGYVQQSNGHTFVDGCLLFRSAVCLTQQSEGDAHPAAACRGECPMKHNACRTAAMCERDLSRENRRRARLREYLPLELMTLSPLYFRSFGAVV